MKMNLHMIAKTAFVLVLLFTAAEATAQNRTASVSGNWNNTATWGGNSVPTSANAVTVNAGVVLTVNVSDAQCASLNLASSSSTATAASLNISGTNALTVTGAITITGVGVTSGTAATILSVGSGTLSGASLAFSLNPSNLTSTNRRTQLTISTGTVNISGNITSSGASTNSGILFTGAGTLNVGGSLYTGSNLGLFTQVTGTTVNYNGAGAQAIQNYTYNNLGVSGSGVKTLAGTVNGTLTIAGTATTAGSIGYGANAILKYNGTSAQTTTNVEFPAAMSGDVVIDNAAGVTLNGAKTLSGSLTLTNGVLSTSSTNLLNFADGFTTISGGSASSYINGPVRKTGNDAFTFKVGKSGVYAPVSITAPDNNGDVFTVEYFRGMGSLTGNINAAITANVARASTCEYWDIIETTDAGNANSLSVTVNWSSNSGCNASSAYINDITALTLLHYNTTSGTWDSYGGTASGSNTSGSILRTGVTAFSPFTLGSLNIGVNPLPVSFTDVKAFEKGAGVQIDWTNATESDMSAYVIERSANGIDFTAIGQTAPRSNQFDKVSYTYIDAAPLAGTNFYRVKAIELSGKNVYTKNLRVDIGRSPKGISLYPNPVRGSEITIGFSAQKGQYNLNVLNTAGQVVYRQTLNHAGGTVAQSVTLPASLKAGVYNVLVSGDNFKETRMFVIQ